MKESKPLDSFSIRHLPLVDDCMTSFVKSSTNEKTLEESMLYSINAGGKRIRPLLFLATVDLFQLPINEGHYQLASALEMIHTYSLIHDDLPAMDNDELRRGKPTNHMVFGEGMAILAGDGLLTGAFQLIAESQLPDEKKTLLLGKLAKASGTSGMIAGQVGDIEGENKELSLAELQWIHRRKTGALIEFALEAGGIVCNQPVAILEELTKFGQHFGIGFQIRDDLLDVLGDAAVIGKNTGMDESLNKSTYTSLLGIKDAQSALNNHGEIALSALYQIEEISEQEVSTSLLQQLLDKLLA